MWEESDAMSGDWVCGRRVTPCQVTGYVGGE